MPETLNPDQFTLTMNQLFQQMMSYIAEETARVKVSNTKFVHYTSAESAFKIIESNEIFLRSSTLMNDFSEVEHGLSCLANSYNGTLGEKLKNLMKEVQVDLPEIFEETFNGDINNIKFGTYLFSLSEHIAGFEDNFGRLSMWRAYAQKDGVALILNNTPFTSETTAIGAITAPVRYVDQKGFEDIFENFVSAAEKNIEFLKIAGGNVFFHLINSAFRIYIQTTKHPSFHEEKEWRIIFSPYHLIDDEEIKAKFLSRTPKKILPIRGIPQLIFCIPFVDYPDEGFVGATIPDILHGILIGPSESPLILYEAFAARLAEIGVQNVDQKIAITGVPLRI